MNYKETLDEAWRAHLAPRAPGAPTVVSLFAGCGGSSLGYSMAGYRELLAVEWNAVAAATFELNFSGVPVHRGDVRELSADELMRLAGIAPGKLDVLDGSPPCQGFSTAGKRRLDDRRNDLSFEFVRLLRGLRPRAFVMENVSGLVKGKMKLAFADCTKELKAAGYRVSCRLLNAKWFGVPQSRERLIWIGMRDDLGVVPSHPAAQRRPIPAGSVIAGCVATRSQRVNPWMDSGKGAATVCKTAAGYDGLFLSEADLREAEIRKSWQAYRVLTGKESPKHFSLVRLDPEKPSPTITKDAGNTCTGMVHPFEIRKLTIPEIKRLSAYPDGFEMAGNFKQKWAAIGNSVPPLMMRAVALHLRSLLAAADGEAHEPGAGERTFRDV